MVTCDYPGGRCRMPLAAFLVCCLLVAATPGSAQEPVAQQPAATEAASSGAVAVSNLTLIFAYSLLALTVVFALAAIHSIWFSEEWPEIESHWGGLGGGLGGIRISPSLLLLAAALAFGGMLSGVQDDLAGAFDTSVAAPSPSGPPGAGDDPQAAETEPVAGEQQPEQPETDETTEDEAEPPAEDGS
jgi:hypothetical protein